MGEVAASCPQFTYMAMCKELHKENLSGVNSVLTKGKQIANLVWRGQRLATLQPGIFTALNSASSLVTLNLSTNSLGDSGVKQLCQLDVMSQCAIETLDLCSLPQQ